MEDQYLRRVFRLKSVSIAFQRCQKCLEAGLGRAKQCSFTRTRTVSSGSKLAVLTLCPKSKSDKPSNYDALSLLPSNKFCLNASNQVKVL
ncbi:hypothetical protein D6U17_13210 [Lactiplantibacillus pentosus]|uniref:Uncharacterized protein n=1 Tax=Lactiplantibacillus pentosus TaxID=1589 RepID=A0AB37RGQ0_LACPE|nr:hypothetical protein D6U20_14985 [Lactiplantibacillus pentosus]RMW48361.1 hypothetical protein D6U19_03775 [Lactiplantibacillus pentosus]RMW52498.1 hypothetical protein D6U17_13210 [Lactiplantibacillus pentosus]RMW55232.1 hypothetical protein D6U21_06640 [Lactiplantibacillus pentosus]